MHYKDLPSNISTLSGFIKSNENGIGHIHRHTDGDTGQVLIKMGDDWLRVSPTLLEALLVESNKLLVVKLEPMIEANKVLVKVSEGLLK